VKYILTTLCAFVPWFLQSFTPLPEGRIRMRCFPGSPAPARPGGPTSMFLSVGDGRSQIPSSGTSQGPAIDVFSFGGSRCRTCRQHLLGARHRRLQLQWWPLSDLPPAHPRWSAIIVFNFGGGRCRICRQDPPQGPTSTSSTSVVVADGHTARPPHGARVNVFSFGGGHCRTCRQPPQGVRHRRLQLRWCPLSDLPPAHPVGPPSTFSTSAVADAEHGASTPRGPPSASSTLVVAAVGSTASTP
jgi:hypothetical protein